MIGKSTQNSIKIIFIYIKKMSAMSETQYTESFINDINGLRRRDPFYVIETYFINGIPTLSEVNRQALPLGLNGLKMTEIYKELVCPSPENQYQEQITRKILYSDVFASGFNNAKSVLKSKKGGSNKHINKRTHKRTRRNHKRV
jgi:hypothetical protein